MDDAKAGALSDHANVVWLPEHEFIEKLFYNATKPRIINTLCKAYLHHTQNDDGIIIKLWKTVQYGMNEYEHNKMRPYFQLFFYIMKSNSQFLESNFEKLMAEFIKHLLKN